MAQPTHKHINLFFNVMIVFEISNHFEKILVSQYTITILVKQNKDPKIYEL